MSRPLTIGERQKLRTKAQRSASYRKGLATKRRNKAVREEAAQRAIVSAMEAEAAAIARETMRRPSLWRRVVAWWQR